MSILAIIIIEAVVSLISILIRGFNLYDLFVLLIVVLFSIRKAGMVIKAKHITVAEVFFLIIALLLKLIFRHWSWKFAIVSAIAMAIRLALIWYDEKAFIYVDEEVLENED